MGEAMILHGLRLRDGEARPVRAELLEPLGDDRWRAVVTPAGRVRPGDRLRFGEPSESTVCLLSFLDAEVVALAGDAAVLAFAFSGPALTEALERLGYRPPDRSGSEPLA